MSSSKYTAALSVVLSALMLTLLVTMCRQLPRRDSAIPQWTVMARRSPIQVDRCAACHEREAATFAGTPHFNTLKNVDSEQASREWNGAHFKSAGDGWDYRYEFRDGALWLDCSALPAASRVDWLFGSGRHAQTPATVNRNPQGQPELIEHRVTRYADGHFDLTIGRTHGERVSAGIAAVGKLHTAPQTWQCFGCHASALPSDMGADVLRHVTPGIDCIRCHDGGEQHAEEMETGRTDGAARKLSKATSPLESINLCGECHRRADQFPIDELVTHNRLIIRFAPVGLAMSRCFVKQGQASTSTGAVTRLDCTTCHDPHQPAVDAADVYNQRCLDCHRNNEPGKTDCSLRPRSGDCVSCHMPKVAINEHLEFTDHWIRVRSTSVDRREPQSSESQQNGPLR